MAGAPTSKTRRATPQARSQQGTGVRRGGTRSAPADGRHAGGLGQPTDRKIQTMLQPRLTHATTICTNGTKAYRRLCREAKLPLVAVNGGKRLQGSIYHVNSINAYHSRLKGWMVRFKGMATPHLQHYLYWHLFTDQATKTSPLTATRQFLVEACCTTEADSIAKIRRAS